ncbi:Dihydrofolate reductase [Lunatimonas lonarensis]|uniref:Dihydrofolate reductase n=1 Tax=Lunatimonas lonarensis TaxID=1232681 RepID=R7ZNX6_9BACT|nr:dihydrofolate reductase [Lunatimonas lonarensis]EON75821.1 Dihydrofolate reductase [Lunatimonas lonarensis]
MLKISIIVAKGENNVIGKDNDLPWHLPSDLKHFKETTKGHHVVMGRKTFESLPKPLPGRTHLVITRNKEYIVPEGHHVFSSLEDAIDFATEKNLSQIFILGGAEIYKEALPYTDELIVTEVHAKPEGDTFFPELNPVEWVESDRKKVDHRQTNDQYSMEFVTLKRGTL